MEGGAYTLGNNLIGMVQGSQLTISNGPFNIYNNNHIEMIPVQDTFTNVQKRCEPGGKV